MFLFFVLLSVTFYNNNCKNETIEQFFSILLVVEIIDRVCVAQKNSKKKRKKRRRKKKNICQRVIDWR